MCFTPTINVADIKAEDFWNLRTAVLKKGFFLEDWVYNSDILTGQLVIGGLESKSGYRRCFCTPHNTETVRKNMKKVLDKAFKLAGTVYFTGDDVLKAEMIEVTATAEESIKEVFFFQSYSPLYRLRK